MLEIMTRISIGLSMTFRERTDQRGAAMVEYALLVALIAAVAVTVVGLLGGQISAKFSSACSAINGNPC